MKRLGITADVVAAASFAAGIYCGNVTRPFYDIEFFCDINSARDCVAEFIKKDGVAIGLARRPAWCTSAGTRNATSQSSETKWISRCSVDMAC